MTEGTEQTKGGRFIMMRSMFAAVSGLKAHQTKMDVIGNNIANVNTLGYRASRVTFKEVFSQTMEGAGAPDGDTGRGGTNPLQVGLGMSVNAVDTLTTRGSFQRTDSPTDLAIEGEGFFIVGDGKSGTNYFTRAGNFGVDKLGNLVGPSGLNVMGWQDYGGAANDDGTYTFDTEKEIEPINIFEDTYNLNKRIIAAQATTSAVYSGNLDATESVVADITITDPQFIVPVTVYDSLGNDYKVNLNFWKTAVNDATPPSTEWSWEIAGDSSLAGTATPGKIKFDESGKIINTETDFPVNKDVVFTPDNANYNIGSAPFTVNLDFTKLTMYAADSSVKPTSVDGYATGSLTTFSIGGDGIIT